MLFYPISMCGTTVNVEGNKDILGIWIGENESSKFWLGVLNELKNRGIDDVLMFCVDGKKYPAGFYTSGKKVNGKWYMEGTATGY